MVTRTFCSFLGHSFRLETVYTVRKFLMTWKGKPKHQVHQYINLCSEEEGCVRVKRPKVTQDLILKKKILATGLTSLDGKTQTEVRLKDTPDFFPRFFIQLQFFFKSPDFAGSICDPKIELPHPINNCFNIVCSHENNVL